jgi:multimeric flavodoxin WrbA
MRLLGLSCGEVEGSAEILLRQAMSAASDAAPDLQIQLIRLNELRVPFGEALAGGDPPGDDAWWFWEALVQCDALLISAPIHARSIPGTLRLLGDRLLGPNADAAFVEELLALQRRGSAPAVPFRVDERVLKPRVAAFIAVGGSLTEHWKTLALPLMHSFTFSMHMAVVDQVVLAGAGTPRSIVLDRWVGRSLRPSTGATRGSARCATSTSSSSSPTGPWSARVVGRRAGWSAARSSSRPRAGSSRSSPWPRSAPTSSRSSARRASTPSAGTKSTLAPARCWTSRRR